LQQPARIMLAYVCGDPFAGGAADPGADLLNDGHQGIAEQHGPGNGITQLCAGLGIGRNAARIVVCGSGNQPWPQPLK
jgi:hypothetical protein